MLQCRKRKQNKKILSFCVPSMKNYGSVQRKRETSLFVEMAQLLLNFFSEMFPRSTSGASGCQLGFPAGHTMPLS